MKRWKDRLRHSLSVFLTVAVVGGCLPGMTMPAYAAENADNVQEVKNFVVPTVEENLPDADELFAGYAEQLFYEDLNSGIELLGNVGEELLKGEYNQKIYAVLKVKIKEIAEGSATSTIISVNFKNAGLKNLTGRSTYEVESQFESLIDPNSIIQCLLMDCPYELYWFDKEQGVNVGLSMKESGSSAVISEMTFSFTVSNEYGSGYRITNRQMDTVHMAVANARAIIAKYEGKSDYEKLVGYRQEICDLVSYDMNAANNTANISTRSPWQLIWVFDRNPSTNVVCEGYAKAFQYLCDLSTFRDVSCYLVNGTMAGGTGAGLHMWNIVTIGGKNYLVDVTNCDGEAIGAPDQLFLVGAKGNMNDGYVVVTDHGYQILYFYDRDMRSILGNAILTLSQNDYQEEEEIKDNTSVGEGSQGQGNPEQGNQNTGDHGGQSKPTDTNPNPYALTAAVTSYNTIMLNWNAVPDAKTYEIFYSTSPDSGYKRLAKVKKTSYKFSKAKCGVTYYFQMRVSQKGTNSAFGPTVEAKTDLIGTPILQVKKTAYNSVTLKWSKVPGAKKYEILYMDSIHKEWESLGVKGGTSFTHKKLVTGATYSYQIRPVRDSFYGSWSNDVSTTTVLGNVSNLKAKAASADRMKLTWKKVKGATQYVILRSDQIDGTYERIGYTGKTSYVDTGLTGGTTYFYKVYAVSGPYKSKETAPVGQTTKILR